MDARERLAATDPGFDVDAVDIADADVLERFTPAMQEWWVEEFGEYVPQNGGFFTPPQREAIPLIDEGENPLVCSPTGSGKCVKPDTPLIVEEDGSADVILAEDLLNRRGELVAEIDGEGQLHNSDIEAFALDETAGEIETRRSLIYSEKYSGELHRIRTVYGREIEATPAHPLLVETETGHEWRQANEIKEGDRVGIPRRIELPEQPIELDVAGAIETLRDRYASVITHEDACKIVGAVECADDWMELSETELRQALTLAGLTMADLAEKVGVGVATVHQQVTQQTEYRIDDSLDILQSRVELLDENEVVVRAENGKTCRFTYPTQLNEALAELCSFVLAEGLLAEYDRNTMLMISQRSRTGLLEDVLETVEDEFDIAPRQKNELDWIIGKSPFALFFSELFGIELGRSREVRLPRWVLNAPKEIKRSFLSTFLSVEAEVRRNEVRLMQANELKIEQLNYLLLSFGIVSSRGSTEKHATNTEEQARREYYTLAVRGKENLRRLLSEFHIRNEKVEELKEYTSGESAGAKADRYTFDYRDIRKLSQYFEDDQAFRKELGNIYEVVRRSSRITRRSLRKLRRTVESLPEDETTSELRRKIDRRLQQNIAWFEVESKETFAYDGEVIDLTVPGPHNFVGGRGGLYLHNTLASFSAILNELFSREIETEDGLRNSVYCLYISPLKSLANDIHRNLEVPLEEVTGKLEARGEDVEVRHAIRHGDTDSGERQRMLEETPHILNTTPETLAILLNSPKFKEKLRTVEYVIVDEIHSLAENKRGTHLSVSLERLEQLADTSPVRIGCSATVEPLETVGKFLVGKESPDEGYREYHVVDTRFVRDFDIRLECPTDDLIHTPRGEVQDGFYDRMHELIQAHTNTLVFTNTRSGAERVLHNLRERFPEAYDEDNSGAHHGSLSKDNRQRVEEQLKSGDIDVVTTSTSLELGIDMPQLDLVIQVGSPKSVAALLQRIGRAGHRLGRTVEGRVLALDRDELVECAVMLKRAEEGFVDRVFIPEGAHDVAAQHVYGMAINGVRPEPEVKSVLRRAYPFRHYTDADFERLMRYLTADYDGLEEKNVYAKVWRDTNDPPDGEHHYEEYPVGEPLIGKRGRLAQMIYMTNIGTIPDSFTIDVFTRGDNEWVGELDEDYLDTLEKGDVFVLGGERFEYRYRRGSKVYVDRTSARPTVPSWFSERLPLSYDLGREILEFQGELLDRLQRGGRPAVRTWLREYPLDENSVRAIARMFDEQVRYAGPGSVATDDRLVVEETLDRESYRRHYYVHSNYGRRFNDGLSRLLAYHCARRVNTNVKIAVADNGFSLSMPLNRKVDLADVIDDIEPGDVRADLRAALDGTDLLKRYFRINATRSLMILKRYKGYEKSAAEQQVSSEMLLSFAEDLEDFAVIEETYREILEDKLNVAGITEVLEAVDDGGITVRSHSVDSPTPRAFGLATLMASDVVLAEDESQVLQEFHQRVMSEIETEEDRVARAED